MAQPQRTPTTFFQEFREFAVKGNAVDLAIGVIIGASFGKIVTSLVSDIIMPPLGLLLGKVDLANRFITLSGPTLNTIAEAKAAGAVTLNYGLFLNTAIDFVIVSFTIFMAVRLVNRLRRSSVAADAAPAMKRRAPKRTKAS